jgi:hypothetical protein
MPPIDYSQVPQEQKWNGKPVLAFLLRSFVYVVPIVASVLASIWLSRVLPRPETVWEVLGWWVVVIVGSTTVLFVVDKVARRMLPLAALLSLTMVFPDRSPSRFRTALKSGSSVKHLHKQLEEAAAAGRHDDPTRAAEIVLQLSSTLNAHDPMTRGHSERVRAYTEMLAEEMGMDEEQRYKLRWASLLHDIGKLRVPSEVLNKPGKLDDDEWEAIKQHPGHGLDIIGPLLDWLGPQSGAIGDHHERYDGNGYPHGKRGAEISLAGRVVCVADAYDVMTTARSYKKPMPNAVAREELARHAGSQFDPDVVRAFLSLSMGRLRWIAGPLSWLAQLPFLRFATVIQNVGTTVGVTAVAATGAAAAFTAGLVDLPGGDVLALLPPPKSLVQYEDTVPAAVAFGAFDDVAVVDHDGSVTIRILANDTVPDGAPVTIVTQPGFGTVTLGPDGTVTYVPHPGFSGEDAFVYAVAGADGASSSARVVIRVDLPNRPPTAADDAVTLAEDGEVVVAVLLNDTDPDGYLDPASLAIVDGPVSGSAVVDAATGRISYTPDPDFSGGDALSYRVADDDGATATARVVFTVTEVNDPPVAVGDFARTAEDTPVTLPVLANDDDIDDGIDPASLRVVSAPDRGAAVVTAGGIRYTPNPDVNGSDAFTYRVCDRAGACAVATARVTVDPVNDAPVVPGPGTLKVSDGDTVAFDPLAGARDVDGDRVTLYSFDASSAAGGVVTTGSLVYTPPVRFAGADTFTYRVTDGTVVVPVTVFVTVTDVDFPPVVLPTSATVEEDSSVTFYPLWGATDHDGDTLVVTGVTGILHGTVVVNPDSSVTYTPDADWNGTEILSVAVSDGTNSVAGTATVTVVPVNDPPVAGDDAFAVPEDSPGVTLDLFANDGDVDGDTLAVTTLIPATLVNGTLTPLGGGRYTYIPAADFDGSESFTYTVADGNGGTDGATVTITIVPAPDAPRPGDDAVTVDEDGTVDFVVLTNDTDPDAGDSVSFDSFDGSAIAAGTLTHLGTGSFRYVPDEDHHGTESFVYTVVDTTGRTATATVTITIDPVPDAPEAGDDGYLTPMNTTLVVTAPGVLGNDIDHDDDPLTVATTPLSGPTHGALTLGADGSLTYVPDAGFAGTDEFTYEVVDPGGLSANATVKLTVNSGVLGGFVYLGATPDGMGGWAFSSTPPAAGPPSDPVPDLDGDGNPGLTVAESGGDLGETDPSLFEVWTYAPAEPLELDGPMFLELWSTIAHFTTGVTGHVVAGVYDCSVAVPTDCTLLAAADAHTRNWNMGVADWGLRTFNLGSVQWTVNTGHRIVMKLLFKHEDTWVAMTADYPTRFVFTAANRPPVANPDVYPASTSPPYLEDAATATIDVAANDFDKDLDLESLTFVTLPSLGTAVWNDPGGPATRDGTLDYTPDPDANGVDAFTYEICDTNGECSVGTVTVTITAVNDEPSFDKGGNVTVLEDSGNFTLNDWATSISVGPADESWQKPAFVVVADDPALFRTQPTIDADGDLKFEPQADFNGQTDVTVHLVDDGGTANGGDDTSTSETFRIRIDPVNDEPSFVDGPDVTVLEDTGARTHAGWATAIDPGAFNETAQDLSFWVISNDNPTLFTGGGQPEVDPVSGDLTYTLVDEAFGEARIWLQLRDDGGTANGGDDTSPARDFRIRVTNVNDQPSFTIAGNKTVLEDAGSQSFAGFVTSVDFGPNESGQGVADYVVSNDNPSLFASQPDVRNNGTLEFRPADDAWGSATVTVQVRDNGGTANGGVDLSAARTFTITVTQVNDAPSFTVAGNQTVLEDAGAQTVAGFVTAVDLGPGDPPQSIVGYSVTNDNNALFATQPDIADDGTLTYRAAADTYGQADVTVYLRDSGGTANGGVDTSAPVIFRITVTGVNDQPSFTIAGNKTVLEDAGSQSFAGFVTSVDFGPNESGQGVADYVVSNDNPSLFASQPDVRNNGTLEFRPADDAWGSATVTVQVRDNGGTANGGVDLSAARTFTITVTQVNDAPSFTVAGNQTVLEDAGAQTVAGFVTAVDLGPGDPPQSIVGYSVTNDNNALFATQPDIADDGTLTFSAPPDTYGSATVTAYLRDDGGTANGGVDTSAAVTFTITVTNVNDQPSFVVGGDKTVLEDAGAQAFLGFVASVDFGPNESGQGVAAYVLSNDNPTLFSVQPMISTTGTLLFTPAANAHGSATVTAMLRDDGGTANGGVDLSTARTFVLTVTQVNDAPSFTVIGDQVEPAFIGPVVVPGFVTSVDLGPNDPPQAVGDYIVTTDNPGLFWIQPDVADDGTLSYEPIGFPGVAGVTVRLRDDGGTADGGVDLSPPVSFLIILF